jgi:Trp operon repressor
LAEKLTDIQADIAQYEDNLRDTEAKINDAKKRRADIARQVEEIQRQPTKFKPAQVDQCLLDLDELQEKSTGFVERSQTLDEKVDAKNRELLDLISACDERQKLNDKIKVLGSEFDEDLSQCQEVVTKLPVFIKQMKRTIGEMRESQEDDEG